MPTLIIAATTDTPCQLLRMQPVAQAGNASDRDRWINEGRGFVVVRGKRGEG